MPSGAVLKAAIDFPIYNAHLVRIADPGATRSEQQLRA